ncbi:MAG TPA: PA2779 family protein [Vicinamibacteria bacterium]|nr:PA2779 family protein [Vicinamibacteria bacterium]
MHCIRKATASLLVLFLSLPSVSIGSAEEKHVVDSADLAQTMQAQVERERDNRELIQQVLERPEVRQVSERFGLDLQRAENAVPTLSGSELEELAARAKNVDRELAGGDSIVLTTTTIIVIALLVTVIILATD